jgi:hypothetical protein
VDLNFDTPDERQVTAHDVGYFSWNPKPHPGQQVMIVYPGYGVRMLKGARMSTGVAMHPP